MCYNGIVDKYQTTASQEMNPVGLSLCPNGGGVVAKETEEAVSIPRLS